MLSEESPVDKHSTLRGLAPLLALSRSAGGRDSTAAAAESQAAQNYARAPSEAAAVAEAAAAPSAAVRPSMRRLYSAPRRKSLLAESITAESP